MLIGRRDSRSRCARACTLPRVFPKQVSLGATSDQFDFALNLNRDVERQFRHANSTSTVGTHFGAKHLENEIREAVDDARLLVEAGRGIHHPEHARPGGYAVEVTHSPLKTSENR